MKREFNKFGMVILAAGRGTRLGCSTCPKVLYEINRRPIISYILEELEEAGINKGQICLVVGFQAESVKEKIGPGYIYARQSECLGTAHAALIGERALPADFDNFLSMNGDDSAFYKFASLYRLMETHLSNDNDITILTCEPEKTDLGRVVRGADGKVTAIVEKENLTPELRVLKEVSTNTFCFKRSWFEARYPNLKPIPGLGEYGLPSFVEEAIASGSRLEALRLRDSNEWFGINTPEQLAEADKRKRNVR